MRGGERLDLLAAVLPDPQDATVPHPTTLMKLTTRCGENAVAGLNEALLARAAGARLLVRPSSTASVGERAGPACRYGPATSAGFSCRGLLAAIPDLIEVHYVGPAPSEP